MAFFVQKPIPRGILWLLFFSSVLAVLSFPVVARAWFDWLNGGSDWRQGDWLINMGSGFIRRGLMGDSLIALSDATGWPLLAVAQLFQGLLFVMLVFVVWLIGLLCPNRRLLAFLAASPAIFLIFWAGDIQGTMRKELFGLLALALLALNGICRWRGPVLPVAAVVLFTLGCIGNILHVFMLPALIAGLLMTREAGLISSRQFAGLVITSLAMSALWMGVAVWFREVPELTGMCARLVARGLDKDICGGAIGWTVAGNIDHASELSLKLTAGALKRYVIVAALCMLPVALSFRFFAERRDLAILAAITFLPLLPLYGVATDWGRWISISYTAWALLLLQGHASGRFTLLKTPPTGLIAGLLLLALVISPEHGIGWQPGGAVRSVLAAAQDFR